MIRVWLNLYTGMWWIVRGDPVLNTRNKFDKFLLGDKWSPVAPKQFWKCVNIPQELNELNREIKVEFTENTIEYYYENSEYKWVPIHIPLTKREYQKLIIHKIYTQL